MTVLNIIQLVVMVFFLSFVWYVLEKLTRENNKCKEELEKLLSDDMRTKKYITLDEARKRDYIVRTKYYGKITDPNIKKDFREEIERISEDSFNGVCIRILNYWFLYQEEGKPDINILEIYSHLLEQYEYKQVVLDTYGNSK